MDKTNVSSRFGGRNNGIPDDDALLHEGGVPKDFPQRLEQLKEASGLSWDALARAIGVDRKSLIGWLKKGVEPCGGAMQAIFRFAARMPGGLEILMGEGLQWRIDMDKTNVSSRFGGRDNGIPDDDALLHEGGVLPKDFPQRLERLKEASGLSWGALARAIGVDRKSLIRWLKKGVEPCGGAMHAHLPFRGTDAQRHGDPRDRELPDELLQGAHLDERPRRAQAQRRHGGV